MKNHRLQRKLTTGKLHGVALTHMRTVAYDPVGLHKMAQHQESVRNDEELLRKAEEKRQRKMKRNAK